MSLRINAVAPDFTTDCTTDTTAGPIEFHKWMGDGDAILLSYPKDERTLPYLRTTKQPG